jgi:predicted Holliday junction resolvase-like endonuclease
MDTARIIQELKTSKLYAECPCGEEFRIADALLFDGTKPFPPEALERQKELKEQLVEREKELARQKKLTTEKAQITTKSVNIGKNLEKISPTLKNFTWSLPDCRFLGSPIDLVTFNGLSENKITSLSFVEIKTGGARLNAHQKSVKDAVEDHKVSYKVL